MYAALPLIWTLTPPRLVGMTLLTRSVADRIRVVVARPAPKILILDRGVTPVAPLRAFTPRPAEIVGLTVPTVRLTPAVRAAVYPLVTSPVAVASIRSLF